MSPYENRVVTNTNRRTTIYKTVDVDLIANTAADVAVLLRPRILALVEDAVSNVVDVPGHLEVDSDDFGAIVDAVMASFRYY